MMGKRGLVFILTISILLGLSACGENAIPEMNSAELQAVGEYAALTLMKYDAANRSRLVDISLSEGEASEAPVPIPTAEPTEMKPVEDIPVINQAEMQNEYSMEEVMGLPEGMAVVFLECECCDKYPYEGEEGYFAVTATEGNELLVLRFSMANGSEQDAAVDILSAGCSFYVTLNDTYTRRALTTVLLEDMSTYTGTFQPGDSRELVLMVEVGGQELESLSSIVLKVKNESKSYTIQLL